MASAPKSFSSTLMGLKFMQRSKEKAKRQEVEEEKEEKDAEAHWETKTKQSAVNCIVIMESAPKPAAALGRISFNNFNPVIERLAAEQRERMPKSKAKATPSKETTISDEAMAQRLGSKGGKKSGIKRLHDVADGTAPELADPSADTTSPISSKPAFKKPKTEKPLVKAARFAGPYAPGKGPSA